VTIGDKNFTEQFVLGELYRQALAAQGFNVSLTRNIGPTAVSVQAIQSGRLDLYPEYLQAWNTDVAADPHHYASARAAYDAAQRFAQAHGMALLDPTAFSHTDAIAVTAAYASQNGLHTIPDLAKVAPKLTLGTPVQGHPERPAGGRAGVQRDPGGFHAAGARRPVPGAGSGQHSGRRRDHDRR
jgi:osmoprotectant transport system substrate-binding protein